MHFHSILTDMFAEMAGMFCAIPWQPMAVNYRGESSCGVELEKGRGS